MDRVNVGVIVTGVRGNFVENLRRDQFEILDNRIPQPLTGFLSADEPAQVVLMVECGPAVYFFRNDLVHAADALLTRLAPSDRVAVVCYGVAANLVLDFTVDKDAAQQAVHQMNFKAGFADVNLASSLFAVLDWLRSVSGKKTIVLVTSGVDSSPPRSPEFARSRLAASDVRVIAVSTAQDILRIPRWRKLPAEQREERAEVRHTLKQAGDSLRELSEITGGRVYTPKSAKDFDRAYQQIAELVRHEYLLEFAPPERDGKVHSIEVRVHRPFCFCQASYRQAYLAPQ